MGLFERESLPRSAKQIDRASVYERDSNMMRGEIHRRNTQKHFCVEETACLAMEENGSHIERRLKYMNFTLMLQFLRRCFEFDNTHIICN